MRCRSEQVVSLPDGGQLIIPRRCWRDSGVLFFTHAVAFSLGMLVPVAYLVLWGFGIPLPFERLVECVTR